MIATPLYAPCKFSVLKGLLQANLGCMNWPKVQVDKVEAISSTFILTLVILPNVQNHKMM